MLVKQQNKNIKKRKLLTAWQTFKKIEKKNPDKVVRKK